MAQFLKKSLLYLIVFSGVLMAVSWVDTSEFYRFKEVKTPYLKIPWIYDQINDPEKDIDGIFLGSSVVRGDIRDSMLLNHYGVDFYNFGVNHPCRALSYLLLRKTLEKKKVKYVFLEASTLVFRNNHSVYPILEEKGNLIADWWQNKTFTANYLKSTAYNINHITRGFKRDEFNYDTTEDKYGFVPDQQFTEAQISRKVDQRLYPEKYRGKLKAVGRNIVTGIFGEDFIKNLGNAVKELMDFENNAEYQKAMLKRTIDLLEERNIPCYFVYYPAHPRLNKNESTLQEFLTTNRDILGEDIQSRILKVEAKELLIHDKLWSDLQHLNPEGANLFTREIYDQFADLEEGN